MKSQIAEFVTESSTAEFKFFVGEGGLFRRNGTPLSLLSHVAGQFAGFFTSDFQFTDDFRRKPHEEFSF